MVVVGIFGVIAAIAVVVLVAWLKNKKKFDKMEH